MGQGRSKGGDDSLRDVLLGAQCIRGNPDVVEDGLLPRHRNTCWTVGVEYCEETGVSILSEGKGALQGHIATNCFGTVVLRCSLLSCGHAPTQSLSMSGYDTATGRGQLLM